MIVNANEMTCFQQISSRPQVWHLWSTPLLTGKTENLIRLLWYSVGFRTHIKEDCKTARSKLMATQMQSDHPNGGMSIPYHAATIEQNQTTFFFQYVKSRWFISTMENAYFYSIIIEYWVHCHAISIRLRSHVFLAFRSARTRSDPMVKTINTVLHLQGDERKKRLPKGGTAAHPFLVSGIENPPLSNVFNVSRQVSWYRCSQPIKQIPCPLTQRFLSAENPLKTSCDFPRFFKSLSLLLQYFEVCSSKYLLDRSQWKCRLDSIHHSNEDSRLQGCRCWLQ
jgi:hypothetical protein